MNSKFDVIKLLPNTLDFQHFDASNLDLIMSSKLFILAIPAAISLCLLSTTYVCGDVLLSESFDTDSGFTVSDGFFSDGSNDYFGITGSNENWGVGSTPSGMRGFTGMDDNFLTGEDLDGEGATLPIVIDWTGIDVASQSNLVFSGDFAAGDNGVDSTDEWFFEVQFDGGGYTKVMEFVFDPNHDDNFNAGFFYGTEALTSSAKNFQADITGSGTVMDLRMTIDVNSGNEDFGVDNLQVESITAVPEPASLAILGLLGVAGVFNRRRK